MRCYIYQILEIQSDNILGTKREKVRVAQAIQKKRENSTICPFLFSRILVFQLLLISSLVSYHLTSFFSTYGLCPRVNHSYVAFISTLNSFTTSRIRQSLSSQFVLSWTLLHWKLAKYQRQKIVNNDKHNLWVIM